jgi:hypothetical protein
MEKYILRRIQAVQDELEAIKRIIQRDIETRPPRLTKLEGLWTGVEISDEEIAAAKREVFTHVWEKK